MNINGTKKIIGIFFPNFKIIVNIKLKIKDNKVPRGYKKLYLESVLPATQGCDFDFL